MFEEFYEWSKEFWGWCCRRTPSSPPWGSPEALNRATKSEGLVHVVLGSPAPANHRVTVPRTPSVRITGSPISGDTFSWVFAWTWRRSPWSSLVCRGDTEPDWLPRIRVHPPRPKHRWVCRYTSTRSHPPTAIMEYSCGSAGVEVEPPTNPPTNPPSSPTPPCTLDLEAGWRESFSQHSEVFPRGSSIQTSRVALAATTLSLW